MGLFKPLYFNQKKPYHERSMALQNEKSRKRLRNAALDTTLDIGLRGVAIEKLQDPELCEAVLMEFASKGPFDGPKSYQMERYNSAARTLSAIGEQQRLERIFHQCVSHQIQAVVISKIQNPALLEQVAVNADETYGAWHFKVSENAVRQIQDERSLARVAIQAEQGHVAEDAVKRIDDGNLLRDIALKSSHNAARVKAIRRLPDATALIEPLKNEVAQMIVEHPLDSYWEIKLLAVSGDKTGRILSVCTKVLDPVRDLGSCVKDEEILEADPDILYPAMKRILKELDNTPSKPNGRIIFSQTASFIKLLHDFGIKTRQIEAELPKTITYQYDYTEYSGDDYDSGYRNEGMDEVTLW